MPELYPSTLQDNFNRGSFNRVPGENIIESEMETGPVKKRRRSTLSRDKISGDILLKTTAEYTTFMTWYKSTLQDGLKDFYFNDPATQVQIVVTFKKGGMNISDVGFQTYSARMSLEVVSE